MIVDQTGPQVVCASFPQLRKDLIARDNFLEAIDMHFGNDCSVVSVDGPQGAGKTTLLANYALTKPGYWLGIFARPTSRITYDPQILLRDLCNQLSYRLDGKELSRDDAVDAGLYRTLLFHLQRRATRQNELIYFMVDGLDEIPAEDGCAQDYLIGLLPFGNQSLRFVVTNIDEVLTDASRKTFSYRCYRIAPFSLHDSTEYLKSLRLPNEAVLEIHRACRGTPGNLASVRRLLETTENPKSLIADIPKTLGGLYEKEWAAARISDEDTLILLACIAHLKTNHTAKELANLCECTPEAVIGKLDAMSFLSVDKNTGEIAYVSEAFRQFAAEKLSEKKSVAEDRIVDLLLLNQNSSEAQLNLPTFLREANRPQDVLTYLSPENFEKMIDVQQSYLPIQEQADIGIAAAIKLNQQADLVKLCAYRSALLEFCESSVWQSHVDCKIAMGDYEGAIALAHSDCMKEDRLQLLAAIAKTVKTNGEVIEQTVLDEIRSLCSQIDIADLGDRAIDIACDLLYSLPDLAIELIEKRVDSNQGENTIDWAFAKFSIEAALAGKDREDGSASPIDVVSTKMRDPKMRRFTATTGVLFGDYSATQAIAEAEKLEGASRKLFLLRQWALANYERTDAIDAIEYAVHEAIRATEYAPNARVFREIVYPLTYLPSSSRTEAIIRSIDSQRGNIERIGPTLEYIWVQLLLAQAEAKSSALTAKERLINIYLEICDMTDVGVKADCLANFIAHLTLIDPEKATNESDTQTFRRAQGKLTITLRLPKYTTKLSCRMIVTIVDLAVHHETHPNADAVLPFGFRRIIMQVAEDKQHIA